MVLECHATDVVQQTRGNLRTRLIIHIGHNLREVEANNLASRVNNLTQEVDNLWKADTARYNRLMEIATE